MEGEGWGHADRLSDPPGGRTAENETGYAAAQSLGQSVGGYGGVAKRKEAAGFGLPYFSAPGVDDAVAVAPGGREASIREGYILLVEGYSMIIPSCEQEEHCFHFFLYV